MSISQWFIGEPTGPLRVFVVGLFAYLGLVVMLRVSGKRTLSKMNAFDFVVTVALGSTLAATILNTGVPLLNGLAGFGTLIGVQYLVALSCSRSDAVDKIVKSRPTLLLWQGTMLHDALKQERVTEAEVVAAIRVAGHRDEHAVAAVVLESTGSLSVIQGDMPQEANDTLLRVNGYDRHKPVGVATA